MTDEAQVNALSNAMPKLPFAAAFVALIGVADAIYLTVHHYTAEPVPCSIIEGCEMVLTSSYATIGDIPLAAFGAAAYFLAFTLALLAGFGNRVMWTLFGVQVVLMSLFTAWLIYLQAAVIGAFCQFCLISAATTLTLLVLFIISKLRGRN
ncbi:MAG TPA: vitamin K epoxide reductase family protein [Pyrinomonadaceae bacterium]|nr:vitamin K epoxide reductase family protein [Pyrinomonadaceae bacterium]